MLASLSKPTPAHPSLDMRSSDREISTIADSAAQGDSVRMTEPNLEPEEGTPALFAAPTSDEAEPPRAHLHTQVNVRSVSLAVLAALAIIFALHWASDVFIPVFLGVTLSYALTPVVDRLERLRMPRAIGAGLLLVGLVAGTGWTAYSLSDDATLLVESLPDAAQKVRQAMRSRRQSETAIDKMQKAATQLEQAAHEGGSNAPSTTSRGVTRVQIERPQFNIKDYLWSSTLGFVALIGQATVVLFITYFLLASGDTFRRKLVKLAGPTFAQKKITVQALDEVTQQIQRYLLVQVFTSVLVGLATGVAFAIIGVQHAAVWAVVACLLNLIPYLGAIMITGASALVGFLQFGSVNMALLVGCTSLVLHTISGYLLTPWLTSRASRMNPVAVFIGVLAFGWLWGAWGLVLGVPILMMLKAVCDRVDDLKAVGELLGD